MNIRDGADGLQRWEAAGRPAVPALAVDDAVTTILHRSQIGALLGLETPDEGEVAALARDCGALLDAWTEHLGGLPFALLVAPTPSRGRSIRNLTVNVFHPFELLPGAPATGVSSGIPRETPSESAGCETRMKCARTRPGSAPPGAHSSGTATTPTKGSWSPRHAE